MKKEVGSKPRVSVAWFKLAELISRGEKEKALTLFRLLSHSFEDRAYALQIEGDILWSFGDDKALELYEEAALLYRKEENIISAIAVYEHLLTMHPKSKKSLEQLVLLYAKLDWPEKFKDRFKLLMELLEEKEISEGEVRGVLDGVRSVLSDKNSVVYTALSGILKDKAPELAKGL